MGLSAHQAAQKHQMASYLLVLLLYSYISGGGAACRGPEKCGCEADSFCNFDDGNTGFCEPCANFDTIAACYEDGLPKKGEEDCASCCPPHRPTSAPTVTAAPTPAPTTLAPTVSFAPTLTHVPTPAPTAPTNYWVLLTLVVAPASVVASAIFLIGCRNTQGRCRLCAAAATVPHIVAMAAWTCWVATFLCSGCSMSIIPLLWLMSAGATFVAACVTGWLVCKHPAEDEPLPTHVSVTIPPDCAPGQTMTVACPQLPPGRQMVAFVVPPGAEAGATIQIPVGEPPVVSAAKGAV